MTRRRLAIAIVTLAVTLSATLFVLLTVAGIVPIEVGVVGGFYLVVVSAAQVAGVLR